MYSTYIHARAMTPASSFSGAIAGLPVRVVRMTVFWARDQYTGNWQYWAKHAAKPQRREAGPTQAQAAKVKASDQRERERGRES